MKRSDAETRLAAYCWGMEIPSDATELAKFILTAVDTIGMLPPTIEEESFKIAANGEMIYQVNRWE